MQVLLDELLAFFFFCLCLKNIPTDGYFELGLEPEETMNWLSWYLCDFIVGQQPMTNITQHLVSKAWWFPLLLIENSVQMRQEETHGNISGMDVVSVTSHMCSATRQGVANMHSISNRSVWLCAKFPGSCRSTASCVLGCHSVLHRKVDLGQRSHPGWPQAVLIHRTFFFSFLKFGWHQA